MPAKREDMKNKHIEVNGLPVRGIARQVNLSCSTTYRMLRDLKLERQVPARWCNRALLVRSDVHFMHFSNDHPISQDIWPPTQPKYYIL